MDEQSFHKSLKPLAVEELLDYYFYRRVALFLIPSLIRWRVSPNIITTISLVFGLLASLAVYHQLFLPAVALALTAIFLDCCDGQVARLTGKSSSFGRALDGLFDMLWITTFWWALYFSGYFQERGMTIFALMCASASSFTIHCWRFDGVKVKYLELVDPQKSEGDMDFDSAWRLMKVKWQERHWFESLLALVTAIQVYFFVRGKEKKKVIKLNAEQRSGIKLKLEPVISLWSFLGEGHHNTIILIGVLLAPFTPYGLVAAFWILLVPSNIWWLYCEWCWRRAQIQIASSSL